MEHILTAKGLKTGKTVPSGGAMPGTDFKKMRWGLPLCLPMICDGTRHREDLAPDSEVISGGEPVQDMWFLKTGILRLLRYSYDGRRQILSLFFPGEVVGYDGQLREGLSIETVTQSSLCRIDRCKFDTMLNNNRAFRVDLLRQKQDQLDRLHWLTWSLGALGPEERLCAFLALSSKYMPYKPLPDGTGVLSMLLPRKDVSDLLATSVETISRTIHKLSKTGVIEIRDPSQFRVLDLKKLIELGHIDGIFEKMTRGLVERRKRLDRLAMQASHNPACYCGR